MFFSGIWGISRLEEFSDNSLIENEIYFFIIIKVSKNNSLEIFESYGNVFVPFIQKFNDNLRRNHCSKISLLIDLTKATLLNSLSAIAFLLFSLFCN